MLLHIAAIYFDRLALLHYIKKTPHHFPTAKVNIDIFKPFNYMGRHTLLRISNNIYLTQNFNEYYVLDKNDDHCFNA